MSYEGDKNKFGNIIIVSAEFSGVINYLDRPSCLDNWMAELPKNMKEIAKGEKFSMLINY